MIKIIAALSSNRVIGNNGKIPWFIKGELRRFKEITMGHNVVMGRKTFESIGNVLEGRKNIIITKNESFKVNNATVKHSFEAALKAVIRLKIHSLLVDLLFMKWRSAAVIIYY